jgi:hypothetical protein
MTIYSDATILESIALNFIGGAIFLAGTVDWWQNNHSPTRKRFADLLLLSGTQ